MPFVLLIFRNLIRQKIRTGLTVLGISIGITAVVAMGIITGSTKTTTAALLRAGGSDFAIGHGHPRPRHRGQRRSPRQDAGRPDRGRDPSLKAGA